MALMVRNTAILLLCISFACPALAATRYVTIGTGGVTGVYYPAGGAISKLVNKQRAVYGLKLTAEATGGSVFNINALSSGDMDLGLSQTDKAYQAWHGQDEWKDSGPQKDLRAVFTLNPETVCLIASVKSGVKTCADLKGKTVSLGNPGSGTRYNALDAISTCGLTLHDLGKAEALKLAEAAGLLQDERIDAFFYTVGHPNGSIKEAAAGNVKVQFVPITNVDELLKKSPFYSKAFIPVNLYQGVENREDVPTFAVKACLLSAAKVPDEVVYAVAREVMENFDTFKALHPAFERLTKEEMLQGLPVPAHPGALKYYKEAGLEKFIQKK